MGLPLDRLAQSEFLPLRLNLPPVGQIGIVVRDIRTAVERYSELLGIQSWTVKETTAPPLIATYRGRPSSFQATIALGETGPIVIELIEYQGGDTIHRDFVESHGEGVEHLGIYVSDLTEALADVGRMGVGVLEQVDGIGYSRDGRYAYLDTPASMGITLEPLQAPTRRNPPSQV